LVDTCATELFQHPGAGGLGVVTGHRKQLVLQQRALGREKEAFVRWDENSS
jgi:hypothetical protein